MKEITKELKDKFNNLRAMKDEFIKNGLYLFDRAKKLKTL